MRNKFPKGNKFGGRPKGSPNKVTLLREERRAIFDQRVSEKYLETIDKARPEYLLDQFLGKAPDLLDITTKGEKINAASEIALAAAEKAYKDKLDDPDRETESS